MSLIEQEKNRLKGLKGKERFQIMIETVSSLTKLLEPHFITPIIVGGLAVEIYTRGQYTTVDIDLVMQRRDLADEILSELGFIKEGRHWFNPELLVAIEIPGNVLEGADSNRVTKLRLQNGRYIYVIGIEDIILDRLRACIHWNSTSDCEWGLRMLKVHYETLDIDYMKNMAEIDHESSLEKLREWLNEVE
ncbi:MAG: hypothetical protein ACQESO_07970 [Bacillota bacterium]